MSDVVERLEHQFRGACDPARAAQMAAYMRDQFAFIGLAAPVRRGLQATVWRGLPKPSGDEVIAVVNRCWAMPEREYQYAGMDYLMRHLGRCDASAINDIERWILTKTWWDTVDSLCRHGAGALVRANPQLRVRMDGWLNSTNMWLIRSAILHQERWGTEMDIQWIFAACEQHGEDTDFFIRKAIGWVLRTYAHRGAVEADEVRTFLGDHSDRLSGLSKREAMMRVRH